MYGFTRRICAVNDSSMAVATFAGEVEITAAFVFREIDAEIYEPINGLFTVLHREFNGVPVAETSAGIKGVLHVRFY